MHLYPVKVCYMKCWLGGASLVENLPSLKFHLIVRNYQA